MQEILQELRTIKALLKLDKEVWTLEEFCLFAGISSDQGYKLTSGGKINYYRPFGKKIYIDRNEAIDSLKQNPITSTAKLNQLATNKILTTNIN